MSHHRQTGRTTRQMEQAPRGAVFVWCTADVYYPQELARGIGRQDLQIKPSTYLQSPVAVLSAGVPVVVDHAFFMHQRWNDQLFGLWQAMRQRGVLFE